MTYFNLRKPALESEPEEADEAFDEGAEETVEAPEETPTGVLAALGAGITGPGRWLTAHTNLDTAIIVQVGAVFSAAYYGGWIAAGVIAAWLGAVLAFIPREYKDRVTAWVESWRHAPDAVPDETAAALKADAEETEPADPHTTLVGWLDELTRGRAGIHLDELHQALTRHPHLAGLKRPEMRAWLDRHQVAVDRTLRVGKLAGRSGVSRATVEALLKALPPLVESGDMNPPVHACDLPDSPMESGMERGGEHAA
jgi:hypothetical protein